MRVRLPSLWHWIWFASIENSLLAIYKWKSFTGRSYLIVIHTKRSLKPLSGSDFAGCPQCFKWSLFIRRTWTQTNLINAAIDLIVNRCLLFFEDILKIILIYQMYKTQNFHKFQTTRRAMSISPRDRLWVIDYDLSSVDWKKVFVWKISLLKVLKLKIAQRSVSICLRAHNIWLN